MFNKNHRIFKFLSLFFVIVLMIFPIISCIGFCFKTFAAHPSVNPPAHSPANFPKQKLNYDFVDQEKALTIEPNPSKVLAEPEKEKTVVKKHLIFAPGLFGSCFEVKKDFKDEFGNIYKRGQTIDLSDWDDVLNFNIFRCEKGVPINKNITVAESFEGLKKGEAFKEVIQNFAENGIVVHYVFYDWRLSVESNVHVVFQLIFNLLNDLKPDEKIDLLGYSYGGLLMTKIAQLMTLDIGLKSRLGKLILLGCPLNGSAQTSLFLFDALPFTNITSLVRTLPFSFYLFPNERFGGFLDSSSSDPIDFIDSYFNHFNSLDFQMSEEFDNIPELFKNKTNNKKKLGNCNEVLKHLSNLFPNEKHDDDWKEAKEFHESLVDDGKNFLHRVNPFIILGTGYPTIRDIFFDGKTNTILPEFFGDGDGVVTKEESLDGSGALPERTFFFKSRHSDLVFDKTVIRKITDIVLDLN